MNTGVIISGVGHGALILFVLLGGIFDFSEPDPLEVTQVSLISAEEFAALSAPASAPQITDTTDQPEAPQSDAQPQVPEPIVAPAPPPRPETTETAAPDPVPDPPAPEPEAEVQDTPPVLQQPEPEAPQDLAVLNQPEGAPRPAPRVAPEPAAAPEPEAKIDNSVQEATTPSQDTTPAEAPPVEETTAPEAATTQIVTEADQVKPEGLTASLRPKARPNRPVPPAPEPAAEPAPTPEPKTDPAADAIAAAVQEAQSGRAQNTNGAGTAASGPPLTQGEKDALRIGVQECWVVDVGSEAGRVTVTVGFSLSEDGKVVDGSLKLLKASDGSDAAVQTAFNSARRAVLRCQKTGYPLPAEKYAHWRDVEITFDPAKMRR